MQQTIVKIDLCGSKDFYDRKILSNPDIRQTTLDRLVEVVQNLYPDSDKHFPDGTLYATEGDCVYLILEKPTVALRATVDFMKAWYAIVSELPDCRAVLDYGDVRSKDVNGHTELVSEIFENISVIEKHFGAGEIGVTAQTSKRVDSTLVQFVRTRDIEITKNRVVQVALANYENPRLLSDSSLVHALFVASPIGDKVRQKAFEALLIEALAEHIPPKLSLTDFNIWLKSHSCPTINKFSMDVLLKHSDYVTTDASGNLHIKESMLSSIEDVRNRFKLAKEVTVDAMAKELSKSLGLSTDVVLKQLKIEEMLEEYLCAIFLEIRFMANYFKSTDVLIERLTIANDFDYILRKHLSIFLDGKPERFLFLKSEFLSMLRKIATKNNTYIASIFHNVLLLYYLNRNTTYIHSQLKKISGKVIYLDTNTLYALRCKASQFHDMIMYAVKRLRDMKTNIFIFDKSLEEYHESLNSALDKYQPKGGVEYYYQNYSPWVWKEYESNPQGYNNSFEYCVTLHRFDKSGNDNMLNNLGIKIAELSPYLSEHDLDELYYSVYKAKKKYNQETNTYEVPGNSDVYHNKVLHDANCINALLCKGKNPFECANLFVTCDFRLSKIRKHTPGEYEFLVTIAEFYEFILPYLFLSDALSVDPVETPNFLLGSAITLELSNTLDFNSLIGQYLVTKDDVYQDYEILSSIKNSERFKDIKRKYQILQESDESYFSPENARETLLSIAAAIQIYKESVRENIANSIAQDLLLNKEQQITKLKQEKEDLKTELEKYKKKADKRKRYEDKTRRRIAKMSQKKH